MTNRNIFAHTAPGSSFPEYISVNHPMPGEPDGDIAITVRSAAPPRGNGNTAEIRINRVEAVELGRALSELR